MFSSSQLISRYKKKKMHRHLKVLCWGAKKRQRQRSSLPPFFCFAVRLLAHDQLFVLSFRPATTAPSPPPPSPPSSACEKHFQGEDARCCARSHTSACK